MMNNKKVGKSGVLSTNNLGWVHSTGNLVKFTTFGYLIMSCKHLKFVTIIKIIMRLLNKKLMCGEVCTFIFICMQAASI